MDTFTYVVTIFILAFAMQYEIIWLGVAILLFLLVSLRSLAGIFLTLATGTVFFLMGTNLNGDILYASVGLVILAYLIGIKPAEEQQGGMNPDMMAALQGMGGDPYGGMGDLGGAGGH